MNKLPKLDKDVISVRFGLNGEPPKTLEEVGFKIHRAKENVRNRINRVLKDLKYKLKETDLKSEYISKKQVRVRVKNRK